MSDYYKKYVKYKTKYLQNKYIYTGGGKHGRDEPEEPEEPEEGRLRYKLQKQYQVWPFTLTVDGKVTRIGYDFLIFDPKELYTSGVYLIEIENEDGNKDTFKKELYKFYKQMCPNSDDIPNDTQHTMKLLKRVEDPEESELINSLAIYCYKFLDKITDSDIQARINQTCHASPERIEKMKKDEEMKEVLHGYTVDSTGCNLITQHELIKIVKKDKAAETIFIDLVAFSINYLDAPETMKKGSIIIFKTKLDNTELEDTDFDMCNASTQQYDESDEE